MLHSDARTNDPNEIIEENERWRRLDDFPKYLIGDKGHIKSFLASKEGIILAPAISNAGYYAVHVKLNGEFRTVLLHRLIASAFIANPDPEHLPQVNHKDGNKLNNCADNLEWCDAEYNAAHAKEHGLIPPSNLGTDRPNTVLTPELVEDIYLMKYVNKAKITEIVNALGVTDSLVRGVIYKEAWRHITDVLDKRYGITPASRETVELSKQEVADIYTEYRVLNLKVDDIMTRHPYVPRYTIYKILQKSVWTKITDELDEKYNLGERVHRTTLDKDDVRGAYLDLRLNNMTSKQVQKKYNMTAAAISNLVYKLRWKEFTDELDKVYNIPPYVSKQNPKLDEATVEKCYRLMKSGLTSRQVSNIQKVSNDVLRMIWKKKSWKKFTDMLDYKIELEQKEALDRASKK